MNQNSLNTFYNKIRQYHYQNFEDQPNINNFCLEIKLSLNWSINNMNIYPINLDGGGAILMTKNKKGDHGKNKNLSENKNVHCKSNGISTEKSTKAYSN